MAPLNIILANWSFIHAPNVTAGLHQFIAERNLVAGYISSHAHEILEWISQPHIVILITVWWITFTIIITLVLCLGFGPGGVVAGSLAAAFQAWAYGAFTPAGGIFATLTSLGMVGMLAPAVAVLGAGFATMVVSVVWYVMR
ncbi:hypothetical protein WHR41_05767 [Cladosporium halotolerans]|uniref:Uncharacterized protein n=1 Tax=Cladosporium halotolerans TaxID=1052096 RepID=A0AB34KPM8_9PEZI